jgi:Tfp pilus assembly protein PilE
MLSPQELFVTLIVVAIIGFAINHYYRNLIRHAKDMVLSAFLEKYHDMFNNSIQYAYDTLCAHNANFDPYQKFYDNKNGSLYKEIKKLLTIHRENEKDFDNDYSCVVKLYGEKCINHIIFYLLKQNKFRRWNHFDDDEVKNEDDTGVKDIREMSPKGKKINEDSLSELYKENMPGYHRPMQKKPKDSDKSSVDLSRINMDNLEPKYRKMIEEAIEKEDQTDISEYL